MQRTLSSKESNPVCGPRDTSETDEALRFNQGNRATAPGGTKHDQGKPDYSLLTRAMVEPMIRALMYGENKYSRGNFRNGFTNTRLVAAAMRHIMAYLDREDLDPESGVSHLGHAMAALGMLLDNEATGTSADGRYGK